LTWLVNNRGEVVGWISDTTDASDNVFHELALCYNGQTIMPTNRAYTNAPRRRESEAL